MNPRITPDGTMVFREDAGDFKIGPGQQARMISRLIARQSRFWCDEINDFTTPEGAMLAGVVEQALTDLLKLYVEEPVPGRASTANSFKEMRSRWALEINQGKDAHEFFMTDRLNVYADYLDVSPAWIRSLVRRWLAMVGETRR